MRDLDRAARLVALTTLDVSDNQIVSLEGLRGHPSITTLERERHRAAFDEMVADARREVSLFYVSHGQLV